MFEKGNFAGIEEMKKNKRLFQRIAPMGVNDILMAVQYKHRKRSALSMPVISFEGLLDETIDPNNMAQWASYTDGAFRNVPIMGDHYFVSTHYKQVQLPLPIHPDCNPIVDPLFLSNKRIARELKASSD